MFEKLLSALPFNPGTVQQLSFYANRLRAERSIRRVGLVFIVLAFLVQFFAFVSPPQATLADSPNDLIDGGFSGPTAAAQAYTDCVNNVEDYQQILAYYGITCDRVKVANTLTINSDDYPDQGGLWSMGRVKQPNFPDQSQVTIPGLSPSYNTLYERPLKDWDSSGSSTPYQALNVTSAGGQTFFLLFNCGNLVSVKFPQPPASPPNLIISKTTVPGTPQANSKVAPGTTLSYRVYFSNSGGIANNVYVTDPQPANTTETWLSTGVATSYQFSNNVATWYYTSLPSGVTNDFLEVDYKVNANAPNGSQICNVANIKSDQTTPKPSNVVCFTVQKNSPPPVKTPPSTCQQQVSSVNNSVCVTIKKSAANLTVGLANANGTTAHAGDLIKYTLYATNMGSATVKNYSDFEDSLVYVLDYSTVVNGGGGKVNSDKEIVWPDVNIAPNQTLTRSFEVRVDNPIPETPTSTSDSNYYNLTMSNTFGNTITINLPGTVVEAVQTTSAELPNTGPGSSVIIGALVVAVAGFFLYRSRLLSKEVKIAISDQPGGM